MCIMGKCVYIVYLLHIYCSSALRFSIRVKQLNRICASFKQSDLHLSTQRVHNNFFACFMTVHMSSVWAHILTIAFIMFCACFAVALLVCSLGLPRTVQNISMVWML